MSEINHTWPDGTPKSAFGAVSSEPLFKQEAKRGPKPMRVNIWIPSDSDKQATSDRNQSIKSKNR